MPYRYHPALKDTQVKHKIQSLKDAVTPTCAVRCDTRLGCSHLKCLVRPIELLTYIAVDGVQAASSVGESDLFRIAL